MLLFCFLAVIWNSRFNIIFVCVFANTAISCIFWLVVKIKLRQILYQFIRIGLLIKVVNFYNKICFPGRFCLFFYYKAESVFYSADKRTCR